MIFLCTTAITSEPMNSGINSDSDMVGGLAEEAEMTISEGKIYSKVVAIHLKFFLKKFLFGYMNDRSRYSNLNEGDELQCI